MNQFIKKFITVAEYAKNIGVSRALVYKRIEQGRIKEGDDFVFVEEKVKRLKIREDLVL